MIKFRLRKVFGATLGLLSGLLLLELTVSSLLGRGLPLPWWYVFATLILLLGISAIVTGGWYLLDRFVPSGSRIGRSSFFYLSLGIVIYRLYVSGELIGYYPYLIGFLAVLGSYTIYTLGSRVRGIYGPLVITVVYALISGHFSKQLWLYHQHLSLIHPSYLALGFLVVLGAGFLGFLAAGLETVVVSPARWFSTFTLLSFIAWIGILGVWAGFKDAPQESFTSTYRGTLPAVRWNNPGDAPPNIIVITLDTLRVDELFGSSVNNRFPNLRSDGLRFRELISTSSWTLPAHASLFTGKLPYRTGAVRTGTRLYPHVPSFVQYLKKAGYRTAGFTDGGYIHESFGFGRGFETYWHQTKTDYQEYVPGALEWTSLLLQPFNLELHHSAQLDAVRPPSRNYVRRTTARARRWLNRNENGRKPFFLFLHTYQAHDYWMRFPGTFDQFQSTHPELAEVVTSRVKKPLFRYKRVSKPLIDAYEILYRWETKRTIRRLEAFIEFMKKKKLYEDSLILFVSDHGEAFSVDPLVVGHNKGQLHEILQRIPAILKLPDNRHAGVDLPNLLSIRDLFPLLFESIGLEVTKNEQTRPIHQLDRLMANPSLERTATKGSALYRFSEGKHHPRFFVRTDNWMMFKNRVDPASSYYEILPGEPYQQRIGANRVPEAKRSLLENTMNRYMEATRTAPDPYNQSVDITNGRRKMLEGLGYF